LFLENSEQDLANTEMDLRLMEEELSKEQRITKQLEHEKKLNASQLDTLGAEYNKQEKDFKQL
jgi:hypothetical protein